MKRFIQHMVLWLVVLFFSAGLLNTLSSVISPDRSHAVVESLQDSSHDTLQSPVSFIPSSYAELGGLSTQSSLTHSLRMHRLQFSDTFFSLKVMIEKLATRLINLSAFRIHASEFSSYYRCHPVCQYYVFTLKRILI